MALDDLIYKARGIDPATKKAYMALFNTKDHKELSKKVIDDLILKFKYYSA